MTRHRPPPATRPYSRLVAFGPLIAVAVLLALIWALVIGFALVQEERMVEGARRQIGLINTAVAEHVRTITRSAERHQEVVQAWITHAQASEAQGFDARTSLAPLLDTFGRNYDGVLQVALVGHDGRVLAGPGAPESVSRLAQVPLPATAEALLVADPVRASPASPWMWPLVRRLANPVGDVAAVVTFVDLARLSAQHERLREKPAGAITIALQNGVVVLRTPYNGPQIGMNLMQSMPQRLPPGVLRGVFEHDGSLTGGQRRLGTFERLGSYPVTVLVSQNRDEVLGAFTARRNLGIGVLGALTLAAAVFSVLLARSQRATRQSQAQFAAVSNAFPLGLFMSDTQGRTTYANEAYFQKVGITPDRLEWGWSELLAPAERERMLEEWRTACGRGEPVRSTLHITRPDGEQRIVSVHTAPLRVDGKLLGVVGSMEDVTERVQQQRAQRMLTAIFQQSTDIVAQVRADGRMLYLNPAGRALLRLKPDDPIGELHYDEFVPAHRELQVRNIILPTAMDTGLWLGETSILTGDGREIDVSEMLIVHRDEAQEVETYSVVMRDITEELRGRTELQRSESILNIVAATLPVLVAVVDRQERFIFVNDAFARSARRSQSSIVGLSAREVLGEAEHQRRMPHIEQALAGHRQMFETTTDGHHFETSYIPFHDAEGQVAGLVSVSQDVTGHKRQHQILLDASQTDPLTGALNRAGFDLRVNEALQGASDERPLALLMVDLDRFKPVNDQHGHATGDGLLVAVAQRLQNVLRPTDMLARLGGDEFAVVLPDIKDDAAAATVARKIVAALGDRFKIEGKELSIGASVGLAMARADDTVPALTHRADVALYQAKRGGRGRYEVATDEG